jgi:Icc-related predicted phosphoesterase
MKVGRPSPRIRIFFATDLHGSNVCWKKFLNAGKFYQADALILGGDMTGKALVPIVSSRNGTYLVELGNEQHTLESDTEVARVEEEIANRGYYPIRITPDELSALRQDASLLEQTFHQQMLHRIQQWIELADERLRRDELPCFVCPGNDDHFDIDNLIAQSKTVQLAENVVIQLPEGFEMISTGWTNPTPWRTFREMDESALSERIAHLASLLNNPDKAIFNLHAPPLGSCLDEAPDLDATLKPRYAGQFSVPVGSQAVRDAILQYQPLLSLHGHVHEGRGAVRLGRTLSINPGSNYEQGILLGVLIDLDIRKGVINYVLTAG